MKDQWGGGILESRKNPKELQRFNKNKKQKQILVGSIIGILLIVGGISLYRSFALYKEAKTFDVLQGTVPDFSRGDIKLAITLEGKEAEEIPPKTEDTNYDVTVECDKGAKGSWNYNKWQIEVKEFKKGTKCNVSFTTTEEEMPNISSDINAYLVGSISSNTASSRTFNCTSIPGWTNFKNEEFFVKNISAYGGVGNASSNQYKTIATNNILFNYDQKTGMLTVSNLAINGGGIATIMSASIYNADIYVIPGIKIQQ